jgi:hypothetical protein
MGMEVCVRLFCLLVDDLQLADAPPKETYRMCIGLWNWKKQPGPTKDSRATDEWIKQTPTIIFIWLIKRLTIVLEESGFNLEGQKIFSFNVPSISTYFIAYFTTYIGRNQNISKVP